MLRSRCAVAISCFPTPPPSVSLLNVLDTISYWRINPWTIKYRPEGIAFFSKMTLYCSIFIISSIRTKCPWHEEQPQNTIELPPCLIVGTTHNGIVFYSVVQPNNSNFGWSPKSAFLKPSSVQSRWARAHCIRFLLFCGFNRGFAVSNTSKQLS